MIAVNLPILSISYLFTEDLNFMLRDGLKLNELLDLTIERGDVLVVQDAEHLRHFYNYANLNLLTFK